MSAMSSMTLAGLLALLCLALAAGCGGDDDDESEGPDTTPSAGGSSALAITVEDMCSLEVVPSYLPWLSQGEAPLTSDPVTIEGQTSTQWYEGPNPLSGASVTLLINHDELLTAGGESLGLPLDGVEAKFSTGAPNGGGLLWELGREDCRTVMLVLDNVHSLPEAEVRLELEQIAEGLAPTSP
jgi:hypothetical protein